MPPQSIANLFWDINPKTLDPEKHKRVIIRRVLNYGTLRDWQWIAKKYGMKDVSEIARSAGRTGVREPARRLAELIFA